MKLRLVVGVAVVLLATLAACSNEAPATDPAPTATAVDSSPGGLACLQLRIASERAALRDLSRLPPDEYRGAIAQIAEDYQVAAKLAENAEPTIRDAMARLAEVFRTIEEVDPDEILKAPAIAREACRNEGHLS